MPLSSFIWNEFFLLPLLSAYFLKKSTVYNAETLKCRKNLCSFFVFFIIKNYHRVWYTGFTREYIIRSSNVKGGENMAQTTVTKKQFVIEYFGEGEKSGGTYTYSGLKHTASAGDIHLAACAVNDLQSKAAKKIYMAVTSELSE